MKVQLLITDEVAKAAMMRILSKGGTLDDERTFTDYLRTPAGRRDAARFTNELSIGMTSKGVVHSSDAATSDVCAAVIEMDAEHHAAELAGHAPTPAVAALAKLAASMYVRMLSVGNRYDAAVASERGNIGQWDKALTAAANRYVKALDTLARVQRYDVLMTETMTAEGDLSRSVHVKGV
jgi:hypothetical protein